MKRRPWLLRLWSRSLWVRLMAAFTFIVFLGASGVIALLSFLTSYQFELYVTRDSARWAHWLAPQLAMYYATAGTWEGVERFLEGSGGMPMMMGNVAPEWHHQMMPAMPAGQDMWTGMGLRVVVADATGQVAADTANELNGAVLPEAARNQAVPVLVEGNTVGFVVVAPLLRRDAPELVFLQTMTRTVLVVALGMGLLSVGVAGFIAHQITSPLRRLAAAAHRVAHGDLSVRVPVEGVEDLADVSLAFNRMTAALEQQQELRRRLMNDVAHELRTPLSVIQAQVEALLDGVFPPTRENLEPIHEQVVLLARLVNDLRELALAEAGELHIVREHLDLAEVIRHTVEGMRSLADQRGVTLELDLPAEPLPVVGDVQRLEQVLINLLDNALRYTPAGGTVTVKAWRNGDHVTCQVRDTGPGIPPDALPFVFERFWRGDRVRARSTGGSGLGLAIARQWVELHGGRIWAENNKGGGATFSFVLPVAAQTPTPYT